MTPIRLRSAAEQVAAHLRAQVLRGGLGDELPGIHHLAAALKVNHKTVAAAIRLLEREGLLVPQGTGRGRRIVRPQAYQPTALRVAILPYERADLGRPHMIDLQHRLQEAGHEAEFARRSLEDLRMDVERVARVVGQTDATAWVVVSASREILEWFARQPVPAFALFGRRRQVTIAGAGPDKGPGLQAAVRRLVELGHRRIVLLTREEQRHPEPAYLPRLFLDELASSGIAPGNYHLPDWRPTPEGFHRCLESLFHFTPPTALIITEAAFVFAAQQYLAQLGLAAPQDLSIICLDPDPSFFWCRPTVSHIRWDSRPIVDRIVRWADNVARDKEDRRQISSPSEFVEGGTIGPPPAARIGRSR